MKRLELTKCQICGCGTTSRGFGQHVQKSHGISLKDYIVKYEYNGIEPTCKCGCGNIVTIRGYTVMDYFDYHSPSGRFRTNEIPKRDHSKWKEQVTNGIRHYNEREKRNNPTYRSGENNNFFGRSHSDATKEILSKKVEEQIAAGKHPFIGNLNGRLGKSSLEMQFESFLLEHKIEYVHNFKISFFPSGNTTKRFKYYDFFIPSLNKLIEIHGTFWHPRNLEDTLSPLQVSNYHNDVFKKELAEKNGFALDVVYDTELDAYMKKSVSIFGERKDVEKLVVEY